MLVNQNKVCYTSLTLARHTIIVVQFDLGREGSCGEGPIISDVKLPPWAESAHEFVRLNREVRVRGCVSCEGVRVYSHAGIGVGVCLLPSSPLDGPHLWLQAER